MKIFIKIIYFFIAIFAVFGFISFIIILLGYRPIIDKEIKPNWDAISSITTIIAVFTALFITKWQVMLNNRKEIKIEWLHTFTRNLHRVTFFGFDIEYPIESILIKFTNTGNRKVILFNSYLKLSSGIRNMLIPVDIKSSEPFPTMTFPCKTEPEMSYYFSMPYNSFIGAIKTFLKDNKIKENDYIIIATDDTTGNTYKYNTKLKYNAYLKHINKCTQSASITFS